MAENLYSLQSLINEILTHFEIIVSYFGSYLSLEPLRLDLIMLTLIIF